MPSSADLFDDAPAPRLCDLPDVLDVEQAAAVTRLGVNNIREMVKRGDLARVPERLSGRRVLIPRRAIERLLEEWSCGCWGPRDAACDDARRQHRTRHPARAWPPAGTMAAETRKGRVAVICRSHAVAKQYRRGVRAAGGRPCNLFTIVCGDLPNGVPEQLRAMIPGMRVVDLRNAR